MPTRCRTSHDFRLGRDTLTRAAHRRAAVVIDPRLSFIQGIRKAVSEGAGLQAGTMMDLWIGVLPFMGGIVICLALLFMFPAIALWLPNAVMVR